MLNWLMQNQAPKNYRALLDMPLEHGKRTLADVLPEMEDRAAARELCTVEEEPVSALDQFAETLFGLEKDVFRILRMQSDGINVHGMGRQLAAKWNCDKGMISRAKRSIGEQLLAWMKNKEKEE